jgi:hypothetical protein
MQRVEIRVKGRLDPDWSDWFENLEISFQDDIHTVLSGSVPDQAALYGLLTQLRNLGLALVSVTTSDHETGNQNRVPLDNLN